MNIGFFEEEPGVKSFVRLASSVLIATGCLIAIIEVNYYMYALMHDKEYDVHVALIDGLVMSGLGSKVAQKIWGENKKTEKNAD